MDIISRLFSYRRCEKCDRKLNRKEISPVDILIKTLVILIVVSVLSGLAYSGNVIGIIVFLILSIIFGYIFDKFESIFICDDCNITYKNGRLISENNNAT